MRQHSLSTTLASKTLSPSFSPIWKGLHDGLSRPEGLGPRQAEAEFKPNILEDRRDAGHAGASPTPALPRTSLTRVWGGGKDLPQNAGADGDQHLSGELWGTEALRRSAPRWAQPRRRDPTDSASLCWALSPPPPEPAPRRPRLSFCGVITTSWASVRVPAGSGCLRGLAEAFGLPPPAIQRGEGGGYAPVVPISGCRENTV